MNKAKDTLGELNYHMAYFYYEYGNFILNKFEKNLDIFGKEAVPKNIQEEEDDLDEIQENFDEDSSVSMQSGANSENQASVP